MQMANRQAQPAHVMAPGHDNDAADMGDCEKMMAPAKSKPCGCCDTPTKAPCPDATTCLLKCGMHVLGVLLPSSETYVPIAEHHWLAKPEKPPDWTLRPPIPPPRV
jgi:hypothetical protein